MLDSERDRLILINEKEELLKEMRFISPRKWTQGEVEQLEMARKRLEKDLQAARDTQSKALTERWGWAGARMGRGTPPSLPVCPPAQAREGAQGLPSKNTQCKDLATPQSSRLGEMIDHPEYQCPGNLHRESQYQNVCSGAGFQKLSSA